MRNKLLLALVIVMLLGALPLLAIAQDSVAVEILIKGGRVGPTNGITFGPDGNLYIAGVASRTITAINPDNGEIIKTMGPDIGVEAPDDLIFGDDGSLYWTSLLTGEVGVITPDGEKQTVAQLPLGANPITISDDGRLFVGLCLLGDALYEIYPDGSAEPRLIFENVGNGCGLNGMDFGPDGLLYGPRMFQNSVISVDVDTGEVTTVADGFIIPVAAKFNSQGELYVSDQAAGQIVRVDRETGAKEVVVAGLPGLDNVAFSPDDRMFISSAEDGVIYELLPDGTLRTVSPGGLIFAGGLATLGNSIFVANLFTLGEFDDTSGEMVDVERSSSGKIPSVFTVAPDGNNLILTSWFANIVQVWDPETHDVLEAYQDFPVPVNAIRFQGDLVVAELGTASVVRANGDNPANRETLMSDLAVPAGLAASEDALWVSDWATGTVWQIVDDGQVLDEPVALVSGLTFSEGMAVTPEGYLLVVETGTSSLLSINPDSGETILIASDLALGASATEGMVPLWAFNGVAVDSAGTIYVTGDLTKDIYRINP